MKESKEKNLRDFIKSHEMRYFVEYSDYSGQVHIKKAFKVEINKDEYWVHFSYGDRPSLIQERLLVKTMEEAKTKAIKLRDTHQKKKKAERDAAKAKLKEVTEYPENTRYWDLKEGYGNDAKIKDDYQPLVYAISRIYRDLPSKEKDDEQTYINTLERYIQTGTIYTQGMSFSKEHIVSVKYGEDGAVQIELINGTKIIPVSHAVANLIRVIFGQRQDNWSYKKVRFPEGKYDDMEEPKP